MSTSPSRNENDPFEHESFSNFFDAWLSEQSQYLSDLISAAQNQMKDAANGDAAPAALCSKQLEVGALIDRVVRHYEHYYEVKSRWVKVDALAMFRPSWTSSLEDACLWIGGWRPTMAFHLLYSKSGLQLEDRLVDLIHGLSTGDLGDLSPQQVVKIDSLQRQTIREEKEITEKMAKHQETMADPSMVELSHVATKSLMEGEAGESEEVEDRLKLTLGRKEDGLKEMVQMADELRLRTLKEILQSLKKTQTVHFLIAAAELHLRIHEWGTERDSKQR